MTDELIIKPLTERKRDSDKESMLNVTKNSDGQFNLEAVIKNVDTMSNELKKINVESQLLLCDLILNFNHPVKAKDLREAEEHLEFDRLNTMALKKKKCKKVIIIKPRSCQNTKEIETQGKGLDKSQ